MSWNKKEVEDVSVEKSPEQIIKDKILAEISRLEDKKKNIQSEIDVSIKQAFVEKDKDFGERLNKLISRENEVESKYADAQFIINKNNAELNKIKEDYAKKYEELDTKIDENSELRDKLLSLIKENEDNQKVIAEKNAKIEEIGLNIAENNRKLAEKLTYSQKCNEELDVLKSSLKNDRDILDLAILRNRTKDSELEDKQKDIDDQYNELSAERKSLEKSKLDFTNESENAGHDIKRKYEDIKVAMDAIKIKENDVNSKQQDVDDKSRFLTLKERQIDEKIKILNELRAKGGNNV